MEKTITIITNKVHISNRILIKALKEIIQLTLEISISKIPLYLHKLLMKKKIASNNLANSMHLIQEIIVLMLNLKVFIKMRMTPILNSGATIIKKILLQIKEINKDIIKIQDLIKKTIIQMLLEK